MRQAERISLHDSAVDIAVNDAIGPVDWPEQRFTPSPELADWLSRWGRSTFVKFPDDVHLYLRRDYRMPERHIIQIQAEVKAPGYLEMAVTYRDDEGEWTEHGAYCGAFEVWWKND